MGVLVIDGTRSGLIYQTMARGFFHPSLQDTVDDRLPVRWHKLYIFSIKLQKDL